MRKFWTILVFALLVSAVVAPAALAAPAMPADVSLSAAAIDAFIPAPQVPSISIDLGLIFTYASDIVSMMMPIVGVGAGISFGFALVAYIIRLFTQIF